MIFPARRVSCVLFALSVVTAFAQDWRSPVRGTWVADGANPQTGDVVLARDGHCDCEIVVAPQEHSAVQQAARFLAQDIGKICGEAPPIVTAPSGRPVSLHLATWADGANWPPEIERKKLEGRWEAYQVVTSGRGVWLVGSDFRGTAYAAYTLSERLGIDPLYLWTGYTPEKHPTLALRRTAFYAPPPTFKYRGFFHDDEDILPRPFDEHGYPLQTGTVPLEWYKRYFETALRLRMNMVAPYVRVQRPYVVQQTASEWGLFYTSHHYDILLSNPWGFTRFGLGEARHAGTEWDWFKNRDGMLNFWRGGVLENRDLDCIWPVGLRGTADRGYSFPAGISEADKNKVFRDVIDEQVAMTKRLLPPAKAPLFHFTLYTEMLDLYRHGKLNLPPEVMIIWTDDNDGQMRALPTAPDQWKHGVYYHLAYFSTSTQLTKQITHTITPMRIADQFAQIVHSGATEYMLVNVSELREYVMGARMIAELCWNAPDTIGTPAAAQRYVDWWSREYFGDAAAHDAAAAYAEYYRLLSSWDQISVGNKAVATALEALRAKYAGRPLPPVDSGLLASLQKRNADYHAAMPTIERASAEMNAERRQYFYEDVTFGLLVDWRQTEAAIDLLRALQTKEPEQARKLCFAARDALLQLEQEIQKAERPPFEKWYRKTWIRNDNSPYNVHRSYEGTQQFLVDEFLKPTAPGGGS